MRTMGLKFQISHFTFHIWALRPLETSAKPVFLLSAKGLSSCLS